MTGNSVALTLALRYLRKRQRKFAALISWVSVAGLFLGVLVLTVVLSVMNGFDAELKDRILGTVPHLLLPERTLADVQALELDKLEEVRQVSEFFEGAGMVSRAGAVQPVTIYGIDPGHPEALGRIGASMIVGSLEHLAQPGRNLVMGAPLANVLGLLPGDELALVVSEPDPAGLRPRLLRFTLVGTYELGAELDYALVVIDSGALPGEPERFGTSGVRLELVNPLLAEGVAARLRAAHPDLEVVSWAATYGELFQAVRMEKALMFLILLLVVAVAAFNIVSGQMMVVSDKRADIAILRTMGASAGVIQRAFLLQGLMISTLGIAFGLLGGVLVAGRIAALVGLLKDWFGFGLLDGSFFVEVPTLIEPADLVLVGLLSWSLCVLSAWLPARRAAALNPVEGLHA